MPNRWHILAALVMTILVVVIVRGFLPANGPSSAAILAQAGAVDFAALRMMPLASKGDVGSALDGVVTDPGATSVSPVDKAAMLAAAAEFLHAHSCLPSAQSYREWRESAGFGLIGKEEMITERGAGLGYRFLTGLVVPSDLTDEQFFDLMFDAYRAFGRGANRARSIAAEPRGMAMTFKVLTRENPKFDPLVGLMSPERWHGGRSRGSRCWWRGTTDDLATLLDRGEPILAGQLGVIVEFENGTRRPVLLTFMFQPVDRRWTIADIASTNFDDGGVAPVEY